LLHAPQDFGGVPLALHLDLFGVPIPGDHLKGIRVFSGLGFGLGLSVLARLARVCPVGDELTGSITPVAGVFEGHVGIDAEGKHIGFALDHVAAATTYHLWGLFREKGRVRHGCGLFWARAWHFLRRRQSEALSTPARQAGPTFRGSYSNSLAGFGIWYRARGDLQIAGKDVATKPFVSVPPVVNQLGQKRIQATLQELRSDN